MPQPDSDHFSPRPTGPRTASALRWSDLVCSVGFAALLALSVGLCGTGVAHWGNDASGVLFLFIAFAYRGSRRAWWLFWAPVSLVLLFAPLVRWEQSDLLALGAALRASLVPGLGYVAGNLIAGLRDTVQLSIEGADDLRALRSRAIAHRFEVRKLGQQMKLLIEMMTDAQMGFTGRTTPSSSFDIASASWPDAAGAKLKDASLDLLSTGLSTGLSTASSRGAGASGPAAKQVASPSASALRFTASEAMSHVEIHAVVAEEVARLAERMRLQKLTARVSFRSSSESPVPLAVRGRPEILRTLVRDLLVLAADSLLAGDGMITVHLRPGLRDVTLTIEDNGRGLNETMLMKLEEKGLATRSSRLRVRDIRSLTAAVGWSLEIQGRLGVGSRTALELPRVDQAAADASEIARAHARPPGLRQPSAELASALTSESDSNLPRG